MYKENPSTECVNDTST